MQIEAKRRVGLGIKRRKLQDEIIWVDESQIDNAPGPGNLGETEVDDTQSEASTQLLKDRDDWLAITCVETFEATRKT